MSQYTFKINYEYRTFKVFDLEEVLKEAGIDENGGYEIVEGDNFDDKRLMSAITDEILFSSA
jgi:hypothetical protein